MTVQEAFPAPAGIQQHVKPDERRVLLAWLDDLFGCESSRALLTGLKGAIGGFHASCCTFIDRYLIVRGDDAERRKREDDEEALSDQRPQLGKPNAGINACSLRLFVRRVLVSKA
jgi:hypothetical protein